MLIKPIELEINPDAPFDNDAFDRKDVVEALVTLIGRISGPYVIAIDAPWGSGKTTFLRMLSACLRKQTHPCLEFNAWETDFADDPLIAFVGELDRLVRDISPDEAERNELWNKTKRTAASVAKRAVPAAVKIATFGAVDLHGDIEKIIADTTGSITSDAVDSYLADKKLIEQFHLQIDEALSLAGKHGKKTPVVIVVDELDRCRPLYAIELLERIKHIFNVENAVFVLAVDKTQLGISLSAVYGQGFNANEYLRRFFDLELKLAAIDSDKFCDALIGRMSLDDFFGARSKNANLQFEAENLKLAFRGASKIFRLTPRAQEHLMSLIATAMFTTAENQYFSPEVTTLLAGAKVAGLPEFERVAREGASIMELIELIEKRAAEIGKLPDRFVEIMIGALLSVAKDQRSREFLQDVAKQAREEEQTLNMDRDFHLTVGVAQQLQHKTASLKTIVKRIDLAAQFNQD